MSICNLSSNDDNFGVVWWLVGRPGMRWRGKSTQFLTQNRQKSRKIHNFVRPQSVLSFFIFCKSSHDPSGLSRDPLKMPWPLTTKMRSRLKISEILLLKCFHWDLGCFYWTNNSSKPCFIHHLPHTSIIGAFTYFLMPLRLSETRGRMN